ncbi:NAD(P)-binding domain-containing protein, partial [Nonomuraea sp. NPDC004297]
MEAIRVALLGHGEVGRVLAAGLAGRARLRVYDPACPPASTRHGPSREPGAAELVARNEDAVRGAGLVIAVTTGADSLTACAESRPHLEPGALYADLSTCAPGDKRRIAELLEPAGAAVVDGAIMAPIPLRGLATPIL